MAKNDYFGLIKKLEKIENNLVDVLDLMRENGIDEKIIAIVSEAHKKMIDAQLKACEVGNIK